MRNTRKSRRRRRKISFLMALVLAMLTLLYGCGKKPKVEGTLDEVAVARTAADEGDIHYIDEGAIALAGSVDFSATAGEAKATLDLVNAKRAEAGLPPLDWNEGLVQAAEVRAQECQEKFSHQRPNNQEWWTVNSSIMYGENLAKNYFDAPSVVNAWMDSPSHRENIMSSNFTTVGVAAYKASDGAWYWAQAFGM